jgi:hypothetical protein
MGPLFSAARKNFYGHWTPATLADETRGMERAGHGFADAQAWYKYLASDSRPPSFDKWATQPHYLFIIYEANAMTGQFRQYAPEISRFPCGGDPSIPSKWEVAHHLAAMAEKHRVPVRVFYFGDRDTKGEKIDKSAIKDIRDWCRVSLR